MNPVVIYSPQGTHAAAPHQRGGRKSGKQNLAAEARCAVEIQWCCSQYGCENRKEQISPLVPLKIREHFNISQEGRKAGNFSEGALCANHSRDITI